MLENSQEFQEAMRRKEKERFDNLTEEAIKYLDSLGKAYNLARQSECLHKEVEVYDELTEGGSYPEAAECMVCGKYFKGEELEKVLGIGGM